MLEQFEDGPRRVCIWRGIARGVGVIRKCRGDLHKTHKTFNRCRRYYLLFENFSSHRRKPWTGDTLKRDYLICYGNFIKQENKEKKRCKTRIHSSNLNHRFQHSITGPAHFHKNSPPRSNRQSITLINQVFEEKKMWRFNRFVMQT